MAGKKRYCFTSFSNFGGSLAINCQKSQSSSLITIALSEKRGQVDWGRNEISRFQKKKLIKLKNQLIEEIFFWLICIERDYIRFEVS